ncbi:hypothetical protein HaLaN_06364 [Haematococcus lacustris]|uniref:ABC transmembrane type-1 domain-containing protein n=1 Tax=Haematococcus lacustris TaxID=44745 RepID=A0A699YL16_HAELA|nr:hypothetical protein HaLaN_06364 [Haematococcus lacustris]
MFTWAASAWLQLAKASAILAVIAVAAPAAASAAAVAWLCRFVLNQVLSLRVYGQRLRGLWATPLHSVAVRANALLQPYLLPEPAEGSQLEGSDHS